MTPITCDCAICRDMCERSTCIPTPQEARELIRRGYGDRLAAYEFDELHGGFRFVAPAPVGKEGQTLQHTIGRCTFYVDGKCQLHDLGLKPLEGRLSHHSRDRWPVRPHVHAHWKGKRYESVVAAMRNGSNP